MLNMTKVKSLITKHNKHKMHNYFTIEDDINETFKKYMNISSQVLFYNNASDDIKILFDYFKKENIVNAENDFKLVENCHCKHEGSKTIKESIKSLSSTENDFIITNETKVKVNWNNEEYTILKDIKNNLTMVKTEYLKLFKKCYLKIEDKKEANLINVISEYDMETQGVILAFSFINVEGEKMSVKEYLNYCL